MFRSVDSYKQVQSRKGRGKEGQEKKVYIFKDMPNAPSAVMPPHGLSSRMDHNVFLTDSNIAVASF